MTEFAIVVLVVGVFAWAVWELNQTAEEARVASMLARG